MRRTWLVVLSWCVGFVWAVGLILNAERPEQTPKPPVPVPAAMVAPPRTTAPPAVDPPVPVPPVTIEPRVATREHTHYVGNTNTHKFHASTCRYADCTNCTAAFATREEALAGGYRPCGICDP